MYIYDSDTKEAIELLDRYDFTGILEELSGSIVYDIVDKIEETFPQEVSEALSFLTDDEVAAYFHERYNIGLTEIIHTVMHWNICSRKSLEAPQDVVKFT